MKNKDSKSDYEDFLSSMPMKPPEKLSSNVLEYIHKSMNPSHTFVFTKLLLIQIFIGVLTMTFCPQFKLSITNNHELFHFFHDTFGYQICMMLCGGIFLGSGAVAAGLILNSYELQKIYRSKVQYYFALCSIFIGVFMGIGVEVYLEVLSFWIIGAFLVGLLSFVVSMKAKLMIRYS